MNHDRLSITAIRGTPRACGRAYGEAFETLIVGFCRQELAPDRKRLAYARRCWRHVERTSPRSADFLRGAAEAARLSLEHMVLLTLHEEIVHAPHCTAFAATGAATRGGRTIVAQNWDWRPGLYPWPGLLRLSMKGSPRAALYHYPGLWACAGVNDAGLALMWTGGGYIPTVHPTVGVPTYVLIAEVLARRTLDEALAYLEAVTHAGSFLFFLGDAAGGVAVVEAVPGRRVVDRTGDALCRANHFTCPDVVACSNQHERISRTKYTTAQRYERMVRLLDEHRGKITPAVTRAILTDRGSEWPWLHQYPAERDAVALTGMTIDSLFAICEDRVLWTCRGGRVPGPWQSVEA